MPGILRPIQPQPNDVIQQTGYQNQRAEAKVPPAIKKIAGQDDQRVLRRAVPESPIERKEEGEKKYERQRGESHRALSHLEMPGEEDRTPKAITMAAITVFLLVRIAPGQGGAAG